MDRERAMQLASEVADLRWRQGEEGFEEGHFGTGMRSAPALGRMIAQRIPDGAAAAVLGYSGGLPRLVALGENGGPLYLLEPLPFDPHQAQNASTECRVLPIDNSRASLEMKSRWYQSHDGERRVTDWKIAVSGEKIEFTSEWVHGQALPADEAFAVTLCAAAGLPLERGDDAGLRAA